jgi:hypothetical protein
VADKVRIHGEHVGNIGGDLGDGPRAVAAFPHEPGRGVEHEQLTACRVEERELVVKLLGEHIVAPARSGAVETRSGCGIGHDRRCATGATARTLALSPRGPGGLEEGLPWDPPPEARPATTVGRALPLSPGREPEGAVASQNNKLRSKLIRPRVRGDLSRPFKLSL